MKTIEYFIITSDKYVHLIKDYSYFFNKNWNTDIPVTILCYDIPDISVPNNFKFHSLGSQTNFGKYWTNALIPFFNEIKSEFVCILIDDLFFIREVNINEIFNILNEIEYENKTFDKFILGSLPKDMLIGCEKYTSNSLLINKHVNYRSTLKPSIWKTEYFKKMLIPNYDVWDFEIKNMNITKTDNSIIICHKIVNIIMELNVYDKGKFNYKDFESKKHLISAEDNKIFEKYKQRSV
jgi:hypothetical protein